MVLLYIFLNARQGGLLFSEIHNWMVNQVGNMISLSKFSEKKFIWTQFTIGYEPTTKDFFETP